MDKDGLFGTEGAKRALAYEFCIPDEERLRVEVQHIDPTLQFMPGSRGRIGCGSDQCLCVGSTHQSNFREALHQLAALPYVDLIDACFFE